MLRHAVATLAVLTACTWPWWRIAGYATPAGALFVAPADARHTVWTLAWVAHALATDPRHLVDANIHHPAPAQLTGSEHYLAAQLLFAPVFAVTANPVLATNVAVLVSYPISALAMARLLLALGCDAGAAWLGGVLLALGPVSVPGNLLILQTLPLYLPLVALLLMRLRARPTTGRAAMLAAGYGLGLFSSYYMAVMLSGVALFWSVAEFVRPSPGRWRFAALAAGAATIAVALLAATSGPWLGRAPGSGSTALDLVGPVLAQYRQGPIGGQLTQFVLAHGVLPTSRPDDVIRMLDLGIVTLLPGMLGLVPVLLAALGLTALASSTAARRGIALAAAGAVLMLGPAQMVAGRTVTLPFRLLQTGLLRFVRFPFRFVAVTGFGTALLGGAGLAAVRRRVGPAVGAACLALAALALVATRGRAVMGTGIDDYRPALHAIYDAVAATTAASRGPLLELPLEDRGGAPLEPDAMVGSVRHWLPLVTGHTGHPPAHRRFLLDTLARLPEPGALRDLVDVTHARWLLLRPPAQWSRADVRAGLLALPDVVPVVERDGWTLARIDRTPEHPEWYAAVARGTGPEVTPLGTRLAVLDRATPVRVSAADPPGDVATDAVLPLTVDVANDGTAPWPATTADPARPARTVRLRASWKLRDMLSATTLVQVSPLARDLPAGEHETQCLTLTTPHAPAAYTLEVVVEQVDGPSFDAARLRLAMNVHDPATRGE